MHEQQQARVEIRSFRTVFDFERRIYRIDRLRLNPSGIPVRGVLYVVVLIVTALVLGAIPPSAWALRPLPWLARDVALPGAIAAVLTTIRIEGRSFHVAALGLLRYALGPRHLAGLRRCSRPGSAWRAGDLLLLPDGSEGRFRAMRYRGPGAVLTALPHRRAQWRRRRLRAVLGGADVVLGPAPGVPGSRSPLARAEVVRLAGGATLRVSTRPTGR